MRWRIRMAWWAATDWARIHDGVPGTGVMAPRCQMPLRFLPLTRFQRVLWFLHRNRRICGRYMDADHFTHTFYPYRFLSWPPVGRLYRHTEMATKPNADALVAAFAEELRAREAQALERDALIAREFGKKS